MCLLLVDCKDDNACNKMMIWSQQCHDTNLNDKFILVYLVACSEPKTLSNVNQTSR